MKQNNRKKWIIMPESLPVVLRRCPKCGKKTEFGNSGKFRVNANGRMLDIWLIYRCKTCETSWNMTIYERVAPDRLKQEEYRVFLTMTCTWQRNMEAARLYLPGTGRTGRFRPMSIRYRQWIHWRRAGARGGMKSR